MSVTLTFRGGRNVWLAPAAAMPSVVLIEGDSACRAELRALLESWGLAVLEPDLSSAMPIRNELAVADAVIADFEFAEGLGRPSPFSGLDLALQVARRVGRRLPTLVVSRNFGRKAIPACSPHQIPVLFRPVHPDLLRNWLRLVALLPDS